MAEEADGIIAATAAAGNNDHLTLWRPPDLVVTPGDLVETLPTSSVALARVDDAPSELYVTTPLEESEASSSKFSVDDEYVTPRKQGPLAMEHLRSEAEFETAKLRENWTVVDGPSTSLDHGHVANRQHFQCDGQVDDLMQTLHLSCDVLALDDDERSELYASTPLDEDIGASSSKHSADAEYVTASRRRLEQRQCECGNEAEFEMAKSREHWTEVGEPLSEEDLVYVANRQHFQRLLEQDALSATSKQGVRTWYSKSSFFVEYGDGELVVGEKIGEGGQAEIFKATLHGQDEFVLKVFKPNISLVDLECQWTLRTRQGFYHSEYFAANNCCYVNNGTLLKDGSFAFLMKRYWGDLRKLIDQKMLANNGLAPPFSPSEALDIIFGIALGMKNLHKEGILHRDLKASNILVKSEGMPSYNNYIVADFESSRGVKGTRFWRAPEVLQALKNKAQNPNGLENIWSEKVDVYSYAMTCYEVLTGHIPFENLKGYEHDVVLRGERPLLPDYIDPGIQKLLGQCWHSNPWKRPNFIEIHAKLCYQFCILKKRAKIMYDIPMSSYEVLTRRIPFGDLVMCEYKDAGTLWIRRGLSGEEVKKGSKKEIREEKAKDGNDGT